MIFNIQFPNFPHPQIPGFFSIHLYSRSHHCRGVASIGDVATHHLGPTNSIPDAVGKEEGPGDDPRAPTKLKESRIQNLCIYIYSLIKLNMIHMIEFYSPLSTNTLQFRFLQKPFKTMFKRMTTPNNTFPLMSSTTIHSSHTWIPPITSNMSSSCRLLNSFDTSTGGKRINGRK